MDIASVFYRYYKVVSSFLYQYPTYGLSVSCRCYIGTLSVLNRLLTLLVFTNLNEVFHIFSCMMKSFMVLCHYNRILRREKEYPVYVGGERRDVLINRDVTFDQFESNKACE